MISLNEFINRTKGKKMPTPNNNLLGQCVSLIQQYLFLCLDIPSKARGNAKDWLNTIPNEGIGKRVSTPQIGDIVVYGSAFGGGYGHIAIYIDKNTMYDQNNATHDNRNAGYGKLVSGYAGFIRMNKKVIIDDPKYSTDIYECLADMKLRTEAGTNFKEVKVSQTTSQAKSALVSKKANDNAVFKKGTKFTAQEIKTATDGSIWAKSPNGYICISDKNNKYCKKVD